MNAFCRAACLLAPLSLLALACAEGATANSETSSSSGVGATAGAGGQGATAAGGQGGGQGGDDGPYPQNCPAGEFASGIDSTNTLICSPIEGAVANAFNQHCNFYYGWNDSCNGCTNDPAKWGRVNGVSCNNGLGADNTCAPAMLGERDVQLFGLNTDGDVDGDDKFYSGFQCDDLDTAPKVGPCGSGELLASLSDGSVGCVSLSALVSEYVNSQCTLYFGWRDSCDGCTDDPAKWGQVSSQACQLGVGADDTCTVAALGGPIIDLLGINTDGDVGGDDKFYLGLSCNAPPEQSEAALDSCPTGMAVTGINQDGTLACVDPLPTAQALIRSRCYLYAGWRDSCDGCTTAPLKWGRVSQDQCQNGTGADNTCTVSVLGGTTVRLFGLNPDGDMDGNDKLYFGVQCE